MGDHVGDMTQQAKIQTDRPSGFFRVVFNILYVHGAVGFTVCVLGPSDSPRHVQIASNTSSSVTVFWLLPNQSEWNGYLRGCVVRYRRLEPVTSSFTAANVTDINRQRILIDKLQAGRKYEASISCFNAACLGPFSDSVQFTVDDTVLQTAPANVTAMSVNSTSIHVSFQPPHFTERSDLYYVITATVEPSGGSRVRRDGEQSVDSVRRDGERTVVVRGTLTTDSVQSNYVTGLAKFTTYRVTVHCETDSAAGPASSAVVVCTLDDGMLCHASRTALSFRHKAIC